VNVLGTVYATRAVLAGMKRSGEGRIVFVSSQVAHCAIYGYTAYAASKWALRGIAEALQMEVRPFNIYVSVSYPPDTDTPGYKNEMLDKPELTKMLSESGVFLPKDIAMDIINFSSKGYFAISHGFDGWLLKLLHPGMSPVNNIWEVTQQILFCAVARIITLFYLIPWDSMVAKEMAKLDNAATEKDSAPPSKSKKSKKI
jgi:3-dehydrosphinganine reductase